MIKIVPSFLSFKYLLSTYAVYNDYNFYNIRLLVALLKSDTAIPERLAVFFIQQTSLYFGDIILFPYYLH
jgi:hypothetical protein